MAERILQYGPALVKLGVPQEDIDESYTMMSTWGPFLKYVPKDRQNEPLRMKVIAFRLAVKDMERLENIKFKIKGVNSFVMTNEGDVVLNTDKLRLRHGAVSLQMKFGLRGCPLIYETGKDDLKQF